MLVHHEAHEGHEGGAGDLSKRFVGLTATILCTLWQGFYDLFVIPVHFMVEKNKKVDAAVIEPYPTKS